MRIRLLPVVLFAGGLLLTVKVGGLWQEVSVDAGRDSVAETPDESAGAPAALPAEPPAEAAGEGEATETAAAEPAAPESLLEQTPPGSAADPLSYC